MGIDANPYLAYYRAQLGAKQYLPLEGDVLLMGEGLEEVKTLLENEGFMVTENQELNTENPLPKLLIDVTGSLFSRTALERGVPVVTTREAALWTAKAIAAARKGAIGVSSVQEWLAQPVNA